MYKTIEHLIENRQVARIYTSRTLLNVNLVFKGSPTEQFKKARKKKRLGDNIRKTLLREKRKLWQE